MERLGDSDRLGALVGRERDVAATRDLVAEGRRLITVVGPPGVGKSRVVAAAVAGRKDVVHVSADGLDLALLATEIARRVAGRDVSEGRDGHAALAAALEGRDVLVLLDDVNGVGDRGTVLGDLLDACPTLRLVVTSTARLRLRGETTMRLDPLPVPVDDHLAAVAKSPAATLFCERAREADPSFRLEPGTCAAVARICRATDGIPLAIELAAGRLRALDVAAVAGGLDSSIALLVGDEVDRPVRHRSMASLVAWSLASCSDDELEVLDVLAAFPAGLPLHRIHEFLDGATPLDTVAALAERSIVRVATAPAARLALPGPVRQSVLDGGPRRGGRARHDALRLQAWALRVALEHAEQATRGRPDAVAALDAEIGNLRAGFDLAVSAGDGSAAELVDLLVPFLRVTGRSHEALRWVDRVDRPDLDDGARVVLACHRVELLRDTGDPVRARQVAVEAFDLAAHGTRSPGTLAAAAAAYATATMWFGWELGVRDEMARLAPALAGGPLEAQARAMHAAANAALVAGDVDLAVESIHSARRLYGEAISLLDHLRLEVDNGRIAASADRQDEVTACFAAATELAGRTGHLTIHPARGLASAAMVALERREAGRAVRLAVAARDLAAEVHSPFDLGQLDIILGMARADAGDVDGATDFAAGLRALRRLDARIPLADGLLSLALVPEPVGPPPVDAVRLASSALAAEPGLLDRSAAHWTERSDALRRRAVDLAGEADVAAAERDGRALSLEAAVDRALAHLERPRAESPAEVEAPFGQLSSRERQVLALVARGLTDKQIADRLVVGVRTVNTHVSTMLRKLGVSRRSEAAAWAIDHGL